MALPGLTQALSELRLLFGSNFSSSAAVCEAHGRDESFHAPMPPDGVVFAQSTADVVGTVKICAQHKVPVIPFGAGTSLESHVAAVKGGVCIDLTQMSQVLEIHDQDFDCIVQPGVTRKQLEHDLHDKGLFFPVDPGADATLGGMAATGASGTNAVRYGTMKENVLSLKVVLTNGDVITTGSRARKTSAGYDLTHLIVGSEGTLGIITEVTLRLYGIPEGISACSCSFETLAGAVDASIATMQMCLPVARIELLDELQIKAVNQHSGLGLPEKPTLFLEFHGTEQSVAEDAKRFGEIAKDYEGGNFLWAVKEEDRTKIWTARHNAYYAALALKPGGQGTTTDVAVPLSKLTDCILETTKDLNQSNLLGTIAGHVGEGNFHVCVPLDPKNSEEVARFEAFHERLIDRALAVGGTCTGEHGIGLGKKKFLIKEHGDTIPVMRAVKQALDPDNIMNPGKIFDF
jgi:D-lactate dehydrogenase (cytochrome)